jgi:8-oxo-dGTP pyrophosphatase MutT (NUDIX family)
MTEPVDWLARLTTSLHPLDTTLDELPVSGFRPAKGRWQPQLAAVLVAVVQDPEPSVVLTVRSRDMAKHAGQVALPGGGRCGDEHFPVGTALRETAEEIGLEPDQVQLLGLLDHFDTISAYRVTPVVGWVDMPLAFSPCPREVCEIFTVPLSQVMDLDSYRRHIIDRDGHRYDFWSMKTAARWPVWGATAAILRELALRHDSVPR